MSVSVMEQDKIAELEEKYANEDIKSLIGTLSGLCGINVFVGREAGVYYGLIDFRNFVLGKYDLLEDSEKQIHKADLEEVLEEVEDELKSLKRYL